MAKKKRVPPVSTFRHMQERARKACLRLPDGLEPPGEEREREIALEEVSLGDEREEGDRTSHLLIESDNLHALGLMTKTHKGMVDLIYIDPPYNTGRMDLGYKDRWEPEEWIAFMFPRLYLAKELLAPHGAIMISIDENEVHRLKLLMDVIFGGQNRIAGMIWQCRTFMRSLISEDHEHVVVYARDKPSIVPYWSLTSEPTWFGRKASRKYDNPDGDERGAWRDCKCKPPSDPGKKQGGDDYDYSVCMDTGEVRPGKAVGPGWIHRVEWEYVRPTMERLIGERRVVWRVKKNGAVDYSVKRFESEEEDVTCLGSLINEPRMMTARSRGDLAAIGVDPGNFKHAKPVKLIKHLLQVAPRDALILDFFAGTGTTGQAVMELNAEDGGTRSALLVTSGENDICRRLTWPRLLAARNATGGYGDLTLGRVTDPRGAYPTGGEG